MSEAKAYWNEGPEFRKLEASSFDRSKPPLKEMPCVFGPESAPPPAPREPVDAVLAEIDKRKAASEAAPAPAP